MRTVANLASTTPIVADLVELRDDLAIAKNLAAAAYMACHALNTGSSERAALCALTNVCRERLEAALAKFDALIGEVSQRRPRAAASKPRKNRR